jgi:hypothetical protein
MTSRGDLLKALKAEATQPVKVTVDKMIEYFSVQLPFVTPDGLVKLYHRAGKIPNTFTRAQVKSTFNGLVLDGIFPTTGGRAELLRAFRGTQPLLVKIPFDQTEAAAELHAFSQLGAYDPSATCILGPVVKLELQRDRKEMELAIEMPICTCSVASVPRPADMKMVEATALTLVTALNFLHSKNRVHGDVNLSNILIREAGDQFLADLGSSVEIGAELATTLNSLPRGTNAEDLKATVELDWFQAGLSVVHLLGLKSAEDRLEKVEVKELLRTIVNPSLNIQVIIEKLV